MKRMIESFRRWFFWATIVLGCVLPWGVGIAMKFHLQVRGMPTLPWSYCINPPALALLVPCTAWLASPFIVFAFLARRLLLEPIFLGTSRRERAFIVLAGLIGGSVLVGAGMLCRRRAGRRTG